MIKWNISTVYNDNAKLIRVKLIMPIKHFTYIK